MKGKGILHEIAEILRDGRELSLSDIALELAEKKYSCVASYVRSTLRNNKCFYQTGNNGLWRFDGDLPQGKLSARALKILSLMEENDTPMTALGIARLVPGTRAAVVNLLEQHSDVIIDVGKGFYMGVKAVRSCIEKIVRKRGTTSFDRLSDFRRLRNISPATLREIASGSDLFVVTDRFVSIRENFPDLISYLNNKLSEKELQVLRWRVGMGCLPRAYQSIAVEMGVTRERVRQIADEAEKKIKSVFVSPEILEEPSRSKLASLLELVRSRDVWSPEDIPGDSAETNLVMKMLGFIRVDGKFTMMSTGEFTEMVRKLMAAAKDSATGRLSTDSVRSILPEGVDVEHVTTDLIKSSDGYVLKKRTVSQIVREALQAAGKPMRFGDIASLVKEEKPDICTRPGGRGFSEASGIIATGDGKIALKEWNLPTGTIVDHIAYILAEGPLPLARIQEMVEKRREHSKCVALFLVDSDKFVLTERYEWTLKEKATEPCFATPLEYVAYMCRTILQKNPGMTRHELESRLAAITGQNQKAMQGTLNFHKLIIGQENPIFNEEWKHPSMRKRHTRRKKENSVGSKIFAEVKELLERQPEKTCLLFDIVQHISKTLEMDQHRVYSHLSTQPKLEKYVIDKKKFCRLRDAAGV